VRQREGKRGRKGMEEIIIKDRIRKKEFVYISMWERVRREMNRDQKGEKRDGKREKREKERER